MPRNEVPFFEDPDYDPNNFQKLEDYLKDSGQEAIKGIKRPNYLGQPKVPPRIAHHMPQARLLAILRNPIERAVSAYFHYMRAGFIPIEPLEKGLRRVLAGDYDKNWPAAPQIIDFGMYYKHLQHWRHYFAASQFLILLYEDIKQSPESLVREAYAFLGVSPDFEPKGVGVARMTGMYALPRLKFARAVAPLTTEYYAGHTRLRRKTGLVAKTTYLTSRAVDRFILAPLFSEKRPVLSDALYRELAEVYRDDVKGLETMLGQSLDHWLE